MQSAKNPVFCLRAHTLEERHSVKLCNTLSCTAKLCCCQTVKVVRYTAAAKLSFIILSLRLDSHACANVELLCNSLHLPSDDEVGQKYNIPPK